jgi:hypothetical protein
MRYMFQRLQSLKLGFSAGFDNSLRSVYKSLSGGFQKFPMKLFDLSYGFSSGTHAGYYNLSGTHVGYYDPNGMHVGYHNPK